MANDCRAEDILKFDIKYADLTSFDIKFADLSKYNIEHVYCFETGDFSSFS